MAKYDGVLPRTPYVRPKSEIYTHKQDKEHPHHFHMRSPSPGLFGDLRFSCWAQESLSLTKSLTKTSKKWPWAGKKIDNVRAACPKDKLEFKFFF